MDNIFKPEILVVDDDPTNLRFMSEILKDEYKVYLAPSGARALAFLENKHPDLVMLDIAMPGMDGYELVKHIKSISKMRDIPVIFLTGMEGREREQEAFALGAVDYIIKPIAAGIVKARVSLHIELEAYRKKLEDMVDIRTRQLARTQDAMLELMAGMTAIRDSETGAHIKRTTFYTQSLVDNLQRINHPDYQISREYGNDMVKSSKLHDIGKVAVPDNILLKPARLSEYEFSMIRRHTTHGAQILDRAMEELGDIASFMFVAREIIISHHEKWDGSGYPLGLKGGEIPLSGRIMAIADVYDALISKRPYKKSLPHEVAIETIIKDSGTHFDPKLVELSLDVIQGFDYIAQQHKDDP